MDSTPRFSFGDSRNDNSARFILDEVSRESAQPVRPSKAPLPLTVARRKRHLATLDKFLAIRATCPRLEDGSVDWTSSLSIEAVGRLNYEAADAIVALQGSRPGTAWVTRKGFVLAAVVAPEVPFLADVEGGDARVNVVVLEPAGVLA